MNLGLMLSILSYAPPGNQWSRGVKLSIYIVINNYDPNTRNYPGTQILQPQRFQRRRSKTATLLLKISSYPNHFGSKWMCHLYLNLFFFKKILLMYHLQKSIVEKKKTKKWIEKIQFFISV